MQSSGQGLDIREPHSNHYEAKLPGWSCGGLMRVDEFRIVMQSCTQKSAIGILKSKNQAQKNEVKIELWKMHKP